MIREWNSLTLLYFNDKPPLIGHMLTMQTFVKDPIVDIIWNNYYYLCLKKLIGLRAHSKKKSGKKILCSYWLLKICIQNS